MPITSYTNHIYPTKSSMDYLKVLSELKSIHGEQKIAVGLSGGVDSSLTAALLVKAGWDVHGLTLWLMSGKGSCCTDGLVDAAGICKQLKIDHHVVDQRENFNSQIVEGIVSGYKEGITPLPCSKCNRNVKFSPMLKWAKENLEINRIATGHYARIKHAFKTDNQSLDRHQLLRGIDSNKDQSYFLYDLSQEVLGKTIFPLGELRKADTRKEANNYGLRTANKPESQDLCLAEHHGSMKAFLENYIPPKKGQIIHKNGQLLGEHDGIHCFTIGQRKGLGVSWQEPLHVIRIDAISNQVIVAPRSEAGQANCLVGEINWVSIKKPIEPIFVEAQVRYRSSPVKAQLIPMEPTQQDINANRPSRGLLKFQEEQFSISPGQAAVFYSGEILLGGGIIQPPKT